MIFIIGVRRAIFQIFSEILAQPHVGLQFCLANLTVLLVGGSAHARSLNRDAVDSGGTASVRQTEETDVESSLSLTDFFVICEIDAHFVCHLKHFA